MTGRPVAERERVQVLDALRGFALIGIFISHVPGFSGYTYLTPAEQTPLDRFGLDATLTPLLEFLIRGKFYSLFSLLFGIGFAIQLESAVRRGADFARHFARRLGVLFAIGLIHSALWYGDILKDYALIGLFLIVTARWHLSTVAAVAAGVLAFRTVWPILMAVAVRGLGYGGSGADPGGTFAELTNAFASSDPLTAFAANLELLKLKALQMIYEGKALSILVMFLLGTLIGRRQIYRDLEGHKMLLFWTLMICAPVGLLGNVFLVPLHEAAVIFPPSKEWVMERTLFAVAVPAMALGYASAFAILWMGPLRRWLAVFAPSGRMALTTYVSQTLFGITLFYGIGFGLRGTIGQAEGTVLALAFFTLQSAVAALWLRLFRFGPLEWVWRRATYGTPIAIRR